MDYYRMVLVALEGYFGGQNWKKLFLTGGCYWLADWLHRGISGSVIMINRVEEHCALYFDNGLYDIRGRIPERNFRRAKERDISFMKKNYVPGFDAERLEQYIREMLPCGAGV